MIGERRVPLAEAQALADEVVDLLEPACERIVVAGSIRRGAADVGDIEVVCIPRVEQRTVALNMFTSQTEEVDALHARCVLLVADGTLRYRLDKNQRPSFGRKYKRLAYAGMALDVFATTADQWGPILLIRTGPATFNQRMVLKQSEGGWLPRGYFFRDGWLWRLPPPYDARLVDHARKVPCPEEAELFRILGYQYVPPEQRGDERPARLAVAV